MPRSSPRAAAATGGGNRKAPAKKRKSQPSKEGGGVKKTKKVYSYQCSADGCPNQVVRGGVCRRHGARKMCSADGCTNQAQQGGVCRKHGAKVKRCSHEGCTNQAYSGGVCNRHGAPAKECSSEGCTNHAKKGGVCMRHGATVTAKLCSSEGCTNQALKGGLCRKHGAKAKLCSSDGCTNQVIQGGLCMRHGAKVKQCSSDGCTNQAQNGGVCIKHGAKVKQCSIEGCTNQAQKGGVCKSHGAKVKRYECSHEGCTNDVVQGGVCMRHGAKRKQCSRDGCTNVAKNGGVCIKHGAKFKQCSSEGCTKQAKNGGVCVKHGAKLKRCSSEGCTNQVQNGGLCFTHGANIKRCSSEGCTNKAVQGGVCFRHGAKVKLCSSDGCTNKVVNGGVCRRHGAKVKRCSSEGCTNVAKQGGVCIRHGANKRKFSEESNQGGDRTLPPLPAVASRDKARSLKRSRTSVQSKRTRTASSPQNKRANVRISSALRISSKQKATKRSAKYSDEEHGDVQDTSIERGHKTGTSDEDSVRDSTVPILAATATNSSTQYEDDNDDNSQVDNDEPTGTEPQDVEDNSDEATLEVLPGVLWDDSSLPSSLPSISKYLTIEEVKNVRLVSKVLYLHNQAKRANFRVEGCAELFLERARKFLGPSKDLFNRQKVEFVGRAIESCCNFLRDNAGNEQGFFQYTNCLRYVKKLVLSQPSDYTILHSLGDTSFLEQLCFRECFPFYMSRPCQMHLRSSYKSQDYSDRLKNVSCIDLTRCSLPSLLLKDMVQAATDLKELKIRRCRPEKTDDNSDEFFQASYSEEFFQGLSRGLSNLSLEKFKFVPGYLLGPCPTVLPDEQNLARNQLEVVHRNDGEIDEFSRLSNRMLHTVCNTQSASLKSLSMRNVELIDGVGIKPLRQLRVIENICLCALCSFNEDDLQLLCDVGERTLRKLSLTHCRLIEGHLGRLLGLIRLEELSLLAVSLCDDDFDSLSHMRQLRVLNVFGQIKNDCDLSQLRHSGNLRHLSLQIYNKVSQDVALNLNEMVSLESLCLRMRFFGIHEMDMDDDEEEAPFIPVHVDEESTLNFSVGARTLRTDGSVMGDTIMSHDEVQEQENALMVESPLNFSRLQNLRSLVIYDSVLTDELVESISGLPLLRELSLWHCQDLSEESIAHLSTMQRLEKLSLHRFDAMSEASLATLSTLDSIKELELYQCGIMRDVEIDNSLGSMKRLKKLTISPYLLDKPARLTHLQLVKDDSDSKAKKRVAHLLRNIRSRGLF